jgi:hypothetical protein
MTIIMALDKCSGNATPIESIQSSSDQKIVGNDMIFCKLNLVPNSISSFYRKGKMMDAEHRGKDGQFFVLYEQFSYKTLIFFSCRDSIFFVNVARNPQRHYTSTDVHVHMPHLFHVYYMYTVVDFYYTREISTFLEGAYNCHHTFVKVFVVPRLGRVSLPSTRHFEYRPDNFEMFLSHDRPLVV